MTDRLMLRAGGTALRSIRLAVAAIPELQPRQKAVEIYLLVTGCNLNQTDAATLCGCTKQNISKHLRRVEKAREDMAFDRALARIEAVMTGECHE